MGTFTGTWRLVRLALRRDRIKLPAWIAAITVLVAANIPAVTSLYGKDMESRINYAATTAPSLVSRIFGGPINGPDLGEIVINETFLFSAVAVAFMSTLAIVRHTRQNEETGRLEMIGSAVVGRHASLTAALIVAIIANVVLFLLLSGVLLGSELPIPGTLGMAAALSGTGIMFAGVAAVTAQIAESARGANALASSVIGIAFMLRAIGDSLGNLSANGLGIVSAWPSWLSPIGWGQQLHPYTDEKWWVFSLMASFFVTAVALAFYCNTQRDTGLGMIAARKGPAQAARSLLGANGLARRLQRGIVVGWIIGAAVMGATMGLVTKEFANMFTQNPDALVMLEQMGGGIGGFEDIFFAVMFLLMGIAVGGYAVQSLQRMRTEETGGQLEAVLSARVSRARWLLGHAGFVAFGVVLLMIITGVTCGLTYVAVTDAALSRVGTLAGAGLIQVPAILALGGMAVLVFGAVPRAAIALSWTAFAVCIVIGQFGELLKLPQAILNLSPFTHTPAVPSADVNIVPLAILLTVALALTGAGVYAFRKRDLTIG